jgi:uncharacterized protein
MTKPTGPICNLDCKYCFYLEKEKLYPGQDEWAMSEDVLREYVRQYIESQNAPGVTFAWQGGEPTLLGLDFYRKVVEFQKEFGYGKQIQNTLQTNAVLIDDEWGEFLAEHQFLVGASIDGPKDIHDRYRVDKGGHGSFDRVMRGINCLKKHKVEFNTLTVVQRENSYKPLEVYNFLKEIGSGFMQFIPIVERIAKTEEDDELELVSPDYLGDARVSKWSVEPLQYGKFLSAIFDEWVRNDVGRYYVQIFDIALEAWIGRDPSLCVFSETCGGAMALEHNGDLYSCDHYVYEENKLGNIMEQPVTSMVMSDQQQKFGLDKRDTLPKYCRECDVRFMCNGECPKHRFLKTPDGEDGLNYLCQGYKHLFAHIDPAMRYMANELRHQRPPANVIRHTLMEDLRTAGKTTPDPNDPCLCGSGRKFKKCCGGVG